MIIDILLCFLYRCGVYFLFGGIIWKLVADTSPPKYWQATFRIKTFHIFFVGLYIISLHGQYYHITLATTISILQIRQLRS